MQNITIAVDAMGGDFGPPVIVPAVKQAFDFYPHLNIRLYGLRDSVDDLLRKHHIHHHPRLEFIPCSDTVLDSDKPITAVRSRRNSSMRLALEQVKLGQADACVSGGNTGALMAMAKVVLKLLPGIERPALVSAIPNQAGSETLLLDLGANSSCDSDILAQFAVMGSALAESVYARPNPRVALLNIGEEQIKGNDVVRQTAQLLREGSSINYVGFIEGNQLFSDESDVIVCDGFVGNVALKTAEGVAQLILDKIRQPLQANWWLKHVFRLLLPKLQQQLTSLNPDQYNGASLLGLRGIVVKSHGHADQQAFLQAIHQAIREVQQNVPTRIVDKLEALLTEKH